MIREGKTQKKRWMKWRNGRTGDGLKGFCRVLILENSCRPKFKIFYVKRKYSDDL